MNPCESVTDVKNREVNMLKSLFCLIPLLFNFHMADPVKVRIQSAEEEADYIWRTIKDIGFFEKNNYQLSLPAVANLNKLKDKSKQNSLTNKEYEEFEKEFTSRIYKPGEYQPALNLICQRLKKIEAGREIIKEFAVLGIMKLYDDYLVKLTLYGSGGSYNPQNGEIILMVNKEGTFKGGRTPEEIIVHEMVHLGFEDLIIQKYGLSHVEKERLVDLFCFSHFKKILPGYKIQNMGFDKIDKYFNDEDSWKHIFNVIERYKREKTE